MAGTVRPLSFIDTELGLFDLHDGESAESLLLPLVPFHVELHAVTPPTVGRSGS